MSNEKFNLAEFGLIKSKVSYKSFTMSLYLFGMTANEWKQRYTDKAKYGNIRDYASLIELIILSNLEAMNSLLIEKNISASNRLVILNKAAKSQIKVLAKEKQNLLKQ